MRIVLVDSSRTVLRIVTDLIELGGHEVQSFTDAQDALSHIKADREVRALITSTTPHSLSGVQLCSEARALAGHRRPLYILLMSSSDDHKNIVCALDSGADDFMHKPPVADELRARLRAADRVTSMQLELIRHATTDALTGVLNRRAFFERVGELSKSGEGAKSAIMLDIDHFKRINDVYGHQSGDIVLREVAARASDVDGIVGRLGGEEFCIVLAGGLNEAAEVAEALRANIENIRPPLSGEVVTVTSSFGVSEWLPDDSVDRLLSRADAALYQAKRSGRNRVVAVRECDATSHEARSGVVRLAAREA
jgi:two-component system, cell cycle response regulator